MQTMRRNTITTVALLMLPLAALAQSVQRDKEYWQAQQNAEFTRRNAVDAEAHLKEVLNEARDATEARVAAEKQLETARNREAKAQAAVDPARRKTEAARRAYGEAMREFDALRGAERKPQ